MSTLTLASIYEIQGHKEDALAIYQEILRHNPDCEEAKIAINRLKSVRKNYGKPNVQMLDFFVKMDSKPEFNEFERWLVKIWN